MNENQTNTASDTRGRSGLSYNLVDTLQHYEVKEITPMEYAKLLFQVPREDPVLREDSILQESVDPECGEEYVEAA